MSDALKLLADEGVSIWLDDLSRNRLVSGDLDRRVRDGEVVGVTTNPSIFHAALRDAELYEVELRELAQLGLPANEVVRMITCRDVRAACDILRPVYEVGAGQDGRVSLEVGPGWGARHRTDGGRSAAAVVAGGPAERDDQDSGNTRRAAIAACLAEDVSVNVTLIFSLERYHEVLAAFLDGMKRVYDPDTEAVDRLRHAHPTPWSRELLDDLRADVRLGARIALARNRTQRAEWSGVAEPLMMIA